MYKRKKLQEEEKEKVVFICDYCRKEFFFQSDLKRHVVIHTGQKDYHCNLCDFSTSYKSVLTDHIRSHLNERPFKCPEIHCGASFTNSSHLKRHQITHKLVCSVAVCPFKKVTSQKI